MAFFGWIENSAFPTWIRTTPSIFGYAGVLFLHTVGFALVVGVSTMIDLRLLGVVPQTPIAPFDRFFQVIWAGVWLSVCSGIILFAQDATTRVANPLFGIKLVLITFAVCTMVLIRRTVFRHGDAGAAISTSGKVLAAVSLALWLGVTTAGRLMAYVGTSLGG